MKNLKTIIGLAAMALCLGFASCSSDDDAPAYSTAAVSNSELMTILKDKGYQFNEQGNLLLDDKATSTTSLNLSGTKISQKALAELNILPNLTDVNLSNNGYGPVFHVDSLPAQIKGIDLQGNEIYDFDGLVDAKVVNDEVVATVLHPFNKLYLPASCKYNVEDLMPFYTANNGEGRATANTIDMKMVNDKGSLEAYNTLREIPDEYFRKYLKMTYASIFVDDTHIDISKPLNASEVGANINLWYANQYADIANIESIEGVEYFINNPYYPDFYVQIGHENHPHTVSYLMPRSNIRGLVLANTETPKGIDFSKATKMVLFGLTNNSTLKNLDLSNTLIANQEIEDYDAALKNLIQLVNCSGIEYIKLPSPNKKFISSLALINLPSLKKMDLSSFEGFEYLVLIGLTNCDITYPTNLLYGYGKEGITDSQIEFAISEEVFNMKSTNSFITKYRNSLKDKYSSYRKYGAYRWSKYI